MYPHIFLFEYMVLVLDSRNVRMLQQDVGFVLTRLISCRRRHQLIKIIPCYRGCFGQPNDTGGTAMQHRLLLLSVRRFSTTASI